MKKTFHLLNNVKINDLRLIMNFIYHTLKKRCMILKQKIIYFIYVDYKQMYLKPTVIYDFKASNYIFYRCMFELTKTN